MSKIMHSLYAFLLWILLKSITFPRRLLVGRRKALQMLVNDGLYHFLLIKRVNLGVNPKSGLIHEEAVTNLFKTIHGNLFVDVGARWGYYSVLLSPNFKRVFAVECHPENMRKLMEYTSDLKNVECFECAVSDIDGVADLYLSGANVGTHSLVRKMSDTTIRVKTITLTSLLKEKVADLVKVDVEGAEWRVLKGAENVMGNIKRWLIELHDLTRKSELESLLKSYGYNVRWVDANHTFAFSSC